VGEGWVRGFIKEKGKVGLGVLKRKGRAKQ
jgi:hypothetical protein